VRLFDRKRLKHLLDDTLLGAAAYEESTQELVDAALVNLAKGLVSGRKRIEELSKVLDPRRKLPISENDNDIWNQIHNAELVLREFSTNESKFCEIRRLARRCGFGIMETPEAYLELAEINGGLFPPDYHDYCEVRGGL